MYIKLHLLGFIDHVVSCDLNKNPWGNEQNNIETHWDSFVSIYYFTCFATFEAQKKESVTVETINNVMWCYLY